MPSPKDGTACTLVPPTAPKSALDAANADPGAVDQAAAGQSQAGSAGGPPFKPGATDPTKPKVWVEVVLVDETGQPVPGEAYAVTLPDGSVASGTLDEKGLARIEGFDPGSCTVTFPNMDGSSWAKK
jgi:type VI secretion system secreted protein VgrG